MNRENIQDKPASCQECLDKLGLVREAKQPQGSEKPAKDWVVGKKVRVNIEGEPRWWSFMRSGVRRAGRRGCL